jgi:hypothetical protein
VRNILFRRTGRYVALLIGVVGFSTLGCQSTPVDLSEGPTPLRAPRPGGEPEGFEDALTGGEVFAMYCNQCHNARALGERPLANYQNAVAHMRVRANLTGKEYAKLMAFLQRWHDVPSPTPPASVEPSPKRLIFPQPIAELREEPKPATGGPAAVAPARPGAQPAAAGAEPLPGAQPQPVQAAPRP